MTVLEEYNRWKAVADDALREKSQAEGATAELLKQLKEKFRCDNVRQAKDKLAEIDAELAREQAKLGKAVEAFRGEYGERLA